MIDENGRIQLTHAVDPDNTIDTMYGHVSGKEWLELEKERIEAKGGSCEIKRMERGIALWVTPSASTENYYPSSEED